MYTPPLLPTFPIGSEYPINFLFICFYCRMFTASWNYGEYMQTSYFKLIEVCPKRVSSDFCKISWYTLLLSNSFQPLEC